MSLSSLKLAVFDCDGTLVDSEGSIVAAMHAACRTFEVKPPAASAIRRMVGLPLMEVVAGLMPDLAPREVEELRALYAQEFQGMRRDGLLSEPLFPGVEDVLDALEGTGWLLGVATGKSRVGLESTLDRHGLRDRFVTLQTADFARGKPHPEMLFNAMKDAGADKAATVMIGDTTFDMDMAGNAGVGAVGVSWGYHEADELTTRGAHAVADVFTDLPKLLEEAVGT